MENDGPTHQRAKSILNIDRDQIGRETQKNLKEAILTNKPQHTINVLDKIATLFHRRLWKITESEQKKLDKKRDKKYFKVG